MEETHESAERITATWGVRMRLIARTEEPSFIICAADGTSTSIFDVEPPQSTDRPSDGNNHSPQSLHEHLVILRLTIQITAAGSD